MKDGIGVSKIISNLNNYINAMERLYQQFFLHLQEHSLKIMWIICTFLGWTLFHLYLLVIVIRFVCFTKINNLHFFRVNSIQYHFTLTRVQIIAIYILSGGSKISVCVCERVQVKTNFHSLAKVKMQHQSLFYSDRNIYKVLLKYSRPNALLPNQYFKWSNRIQIFGNKY